MKIHSSRAELSSSIVKEASELVLASSLLFISAGSLWAHFALGGSFLEPALLACWFLIHLTGLIILRWEKLEKPLVGIGLLTLNLYFHISLNQLEIPYLPTAPLFFLITALSLSAFRNRSIGFFSITAVLAWASSYYWMKSSTDGEGAAAVNTAFFFALGVNLFFICVFFVGVQFFGRRIAKSFALLGPRQSFDEQRLHAAKLQTLGELSASIIHEINNPLSSINGYSHQIKCELEESSTPDAHTIQVANERIKFNVDRIIEISKALRSFSRKQTSEDFSKVSLNEVLRDSVVLVTASFKLAKVDLHLEIPSDEALVNGNFVQLSQILVNLLTNARDAVSTSDRKKVSTGFFTKEGRQCLWVEDTGPGISDAQAADIFKAFFTTKAAGVGTGLGLYISQMIAERHGAELKFHSSRDARGRVRGTRFELWIPALNAVPAVSAA